MDDKKGRRSTRSEPWLSTSDGNDRTLVQKLAQFSDFRLWLAIAALVVVAILLVLWGEQSTIAIAIPLLIALLDQALKNRSFARELIRLQNQVEELRERP